MKNSKSATGACSQSTSNDKDRRRQSLSNEIRRLCSLVKEQVNDFRQDGILTEKLQRQAANFAAITDPLAQSIDEGTSKGHQLTELQQKYEELAEQLRSKDLENERLREKVKGANNIDRSVLPSLGIVQKQEIREARRIAKSESKEPTSAATWSPIKNADDRAEQDLEPSHTESLTGGALPTASKLCRIMPSFTKLHEAIYPDVKDPHAHLRTNDMGAELRKWYEQLPKPKKRIDTVAYLIGQQNWIVSGIADLPKTPGRADEDDGDRAASEEIADMEGHAPSEDGKALEQDAQDDGDDDRVRPLKFSLKVPRKTSALSSSSSAGPPRASLPTPLTLIDPEITTATDKNSPHSARQDTIIKQETQTSGPAPLLPPKPLARNRDTPWDPRHLIQRTLISSASSTNAARAKRPRSPSSKRHPPKGPKRWIDSVCRPCLRTRSICSGEVVCEACEINGRRCEYIRCRKGLACRHPRCRLVHPGALDEVEGEWVLVDQ